MEQKHKALLTLLFLIAILTIFYFATKVITQYTGYSVKETNLDSFNKCLAEKGAVMYGAYWCSHCKEQKKILANSNYIPYVECDPSGNNPQTEKCLAAGITGYPTWIIAEKQYPGAQTLDKLSQLTGCPIK